LAENICNNRRPRIMDMRNIGDGIYRANGRHGEDIEATAQLAFAAGATVAVVEDVDGHVHFLSLDNDTNLSALLAKAQPSHHLYSGQHISFHTEAEQFVLETLRSAMYPVRTVIV
jgi:hypothetical protein